MKLTQTHVDRCSITDGLNLQHAAPILHMQAGKVCSSCLTVAKMLHVMYCRRVQTDMLCRSKVN